MRSRSDDLDVKLLLYAIQKTTSFEKTLAQRFLQSPYMEEVSGDRVKSTTPSKYHFFPETNQLLCFSCLEISLSRGTRYP